MAQSSKDRSFGLQRVGQPQAIADTLTIERVDAPNAEAPGNSVTVTVTVSCQAAPFTNCEAAVRFQMGDQEQRVPQAGVRDISEGARDQFSATFQMPPSSTSVVVEALEQGSLGRFNVEDSAQVPIESITEGEKIQRDVISFVPWVVGGGAVGGGAAQLTNRSTVGGVAAGAGAGVASKVVLNQLGGISVGQLVPEFPTTAVLATAGLLGTAALLLVLTPLDEALLGTSVAAGLSQ